MAWCLCLLSGACLLHLRRALVASGPRSRAAPGVLSCRCLMLVALCPNTLTLLCPPRWEPEAELHRVWRHIQCQPSSERNFMEPPKQGARPLPTSCGGCPQACRSAAAFPDPGGTENGETGLQTQYRSSLHCFWQLWGCFGQMCRFRRQKSVLKLLVCFCCGCGLCLSYKYSRFLITFGRRKRHPAASHCFSAP